MLHDPKITGLENEDGDEGEEDHVWAHSLKNLCGLSDDAEAFSEIADDDAEHE